ncbi:cytochrome-c oxidase, cbb3-type subunit III [Helicobacter sp. 13S00482-2]|uniref:cytochrome-c oxidase, cbb3-type subunit III n=1 Tax=Helicobacter sp. 13S00482-2 TaxID=1476200 RepID=UPI000BA7588F|nr:cytochrome-c oxidase, cbb3-type subunit III [Helicobacter sp. 13S00482-2]PAF54525.1 cytochrome-c oxidase, cbb3-type subunit III [Helicobacter sp. 13S00482-2]
MGWLSDNVNLFSLIAAIVILVLTIFIAGLLIKKMRDSKADGELTDHKWDGIAEFKNNIPIGYAICFLGLIFWGFWYMFVGYPLDSYSQIGDYNQQVDTHNKKFEQKWQNLDNTDLIQMGEGIFLVQCSQCHGIDAEGMDGKAQNLHRWGKEEGIIYTIEHGSSGLGYPIDMPPFEGAISKEDSKAIAVYVMNVLSDKKKNINDVKDSNKRSVLQDEIKKGKQAFDSMCASCHGNDGAGNDGMAADLRKYGTFDFVKNVLEHGKKGNIGEMPSFAYRNFTDTQIKAISAYIGSLQPLSDE